MKAHRWKATHKSSGITWSASTLQALCEAMDANEYTVDDWKIEDLNVNYRNVEDTKWGLTSEDIAEAFGFGN